MEVIRSRKNPQIRTLEKLKTKKGREKLGAYLLEGPHLVQEAIQTNADIEKIYASPESMEDKYQAYPTQLLSSELAQKLANTQTSQAVFAVVRINHEAGQADPEDLSRGLLLLDGIQDPGNLGTLIRTADAFGYRDIFLGQGTVDPYNDKVLRSMQGSHFHVRLQRTDLLSLIPELQGRGYFVVTTELNPEACSLENFSQNRPGRWAVVLGNEGNGVRSKVSQLADQPIYIEMTGQAESLNVAVAGAIFMYETRQSLP